MLNYQRVCFHFQLILIEIIMKWLRIMKSMAEIHSIIHCAIPDHIPTRSQ